MITKSLNQKSFDALTSSQLQKFKEKIRSLERENETLKKKYSDLIEKNKNLYKELEKSKVSENNCSYSKIISEELEVKKKKLAECEENIEFFKQHIAFLVDENAKSSESYAEEVKKLKSQLEIFDEMPNISSICNMKEIISKQSKEIILLKENNKLLENIIEKIKDEVLKVQTNETEEFKKLCSQLSFLRNALEQEKLKCQKLIEENAYFKAKCKNTNYELENIKKKYSRSESYSKLLS
ncbi:hypothetical protein SteCoe_24032 [Stentor coeruleus]|uniref:Uncharacterized protein n=1 Tax=Stentor coeruleus TaxID=5963 RepID=A0A1R2BIH4_9CILI|nr:hypothetical protein SteCoe_24032 [Stentor coeruleus]